VRNRKPHDYVAGFESLRENTKQTLRIRYKYYLIKHDDGDEGKKGEEEE
jgi:hypothetical protein